MEFIVKVHAQSPDAVAKSTIPFAVPGGPTSTGFPSVTPTDIIAAEPIIYLEADKIQVAVSDTVTIKVKINTAGQSIQSLSYTIKYDPLFFKIIDADTSTPNIQTLYNDTFFTLDLNEVDESTGTIAISGSSIDGVASISGRDVSEFQLKAIKEGFSQVSINQDESTLLDENNIDILKVVSDPLSFTISNAQVTALITATKVGPSPTGTLPRNGFFDEFGATNAFVSGLILIAIGSYLFSLQKHVEEED
jgi:hypothetical protein